ncbi:uncharacterized protein LOC143235656 [Tachypleus tridentatus]|uniref:uncharacterized protein LOC143235656 n=1 Tax=Tachypleus tridentatus TaxID=6853 RepID=UPI003FD6B2D3
MDLMRLVLSMCTFILCTQAVRRHLIENEMARAVQMLADGHSQRRVAHRVGGSPSVINRLWRRYQETNSYGRRPGQRRLLCCAAMTGICLCGNTSLLILDRGALNARRYINEILEPIVRPSVEGVGDGFILMQVNARAHVARLCTDFDEEGIETFKWPARSPYLNPIEHCWDILSRGVSECHHPPQNVQELRQALIDE